MLLSKQSLLLFTAALSVLSSTLVAAAQRSSFRMPGQSRRGGLSRAAQMRRQTISSLTGRSGAAGGLGSVPSIFQIQRSQRSSAPSGLANPFLAPTGGSPFSSLAAAASLSGLSSGLLGSSSVGGGGLSGLGGSPLGCRGPTRSDLQGPFYIKKAPKKTDGTICANREAVPLEMVGKVIDENCVYPVKATIDVWQATADGNYTGLLSNMQPKNPDLYRMGYNDYECRGQIETDEIGNYMFKTAYPGLYPGRPRHLNIKVSAEGYDTLTTQIYFREDDTREIYRWTSAAVTNLLATCGGCNQENCRNMYYQQLEGCYGCSEPSQIAETTKSMSNGVIYRRGSINIYLKRSPKEPDTVKQPFETVPIQYAPAPRAAAPTARTARGSSSLFYYPQSTASQLAGAAATAALPGASAGAAGSRQSLAQYAFGQGQTFIYPSTVQQAAQAQTLAASGGVQAAQTIPTAAQTAVASASAGSSAGASSSQSGGAGIQLVGPATPAGVGVGVGPATAAVAGTPAAAATNPNPSSTLKSKRK